MMDIDRLVPALPFCAFLGYLISFSSYWLVDSWHLQDWIDRPQAMHACCILIAYIHAWAT